MASGLVKAKLLPPVMLSGVVVLLYGVVGGRDAAPRLLLSSDPMVPKDRQSVTISCRDTRGNNITTARWYRNNVEIFQTNHSYTNLTLCMNGNTSVSGRVVVDATIRHHDVILQFNSTLDDRSVWLCRNDYGSSYNMTLCSELRDDCIRPNLTMEPQKAADGNNITLSCRHGGGRTVTTVLWYRNYVYIFQTSAGFPEALQDKQSDKEDYKAVEERISVKANSTVHNVILRMNSTLDAESVWTCDNNQKFSSDLDIDTNQTEESTPLPLQSTTTTDKNDTSRKTTTVLTTTMATTEEYDTSRKATTALKITMATTEEYVCTAEGTTSATTLTTSQSKDLSSTQQPTVQTTTPVSSTNNEFILYVVVGSAGGLVLVISIAVAVCLVCIKKWMGSKDSGKGKNVNADGRPGGNGGGLQMAVMDSNEYAYIGNINRCDVQFERETTDMVDNVMYHDYTYRSRTEGEDKLYPGEIREPVEMVDNVCYSGCSDSDDVSDTSYWEIMYSPR